MPNLSLKINKLTRLSFVILLFAATALGSLMALRAQRMSPVRIVSILTRPLRNGTAVTLSADTALNRLQTWKDSEGFHVVLLDAEQSLIKEVPRGVRVNRIGNSLEVLVQTRADAEVKVEPLFNRLTLLVRGGLDTSLRDDANQATNLRPCWPEFNGPNSKALLPCDKSERSAASSTTTSETRSTPQPLDTAPLTTPAAAPMSYTTSASSTIGPTTSATSSVLYYPSLSDRAANEEAQRNATPQASQHNAAGPAYSVNVPAVAYDDEADLPKAKVEIHSDEGFGILSALTSPLGALVFLACGSLLLLILRQRRLTTQSVTVLDEVVEPDKLSEVDAKVKVNARSLSKRGNGQLLTLAKENPVRTLEIHALELTWDGPQPAQSGAASTVAATLFGEERIKQEVSMLVKGFPYCMDIFAARATADRKALEASLIEAANASDLDEDDRARARRALEERGFVMRKGATLLSATDVSERATAARALAQMSSHRASPFLLEALHDDEATVRTEAINSIGALKTPSAIGALLDVALRHPETPISLLGNVLEACSFETFDSIKFWTECPSSTPTNNANMKGRQNAPDLVPEIDALPESDDDENLNKSLLRLQDRDLNVRTAAVRTLGQFRVQRAVRALAAMALHDTSASVRAAAVTSLGNINHECVFAYLLIAFADDARDVRAAAARSLSRLSIERTEAYVRLLETKDETILRDVAQACIKTGMISQAVDKLTSPDRHQAYEAFLVLSLLSQLNETGALLNAVERCQDDKARLAAVGLLGLPQPLKADSPAA